MVDVSYVYDSDRDDLLEELEKEHFSNKTLDCIQVEDSLCLPPSYDGRNYKGGVFEHDNLISASSMHEGLGGYYSYDSTKVRKIEGLCIFIGWIHHIWGHSFTDGIKHLWYLDTDECKQYLRKGAKLVYMYSKNCVPYDNILTLFKMFEVDLEDCILIDVPTFIDEIIIPFPCQFGDNNKKKYTKEYVSLIDVVKSKINLSTPVYEKVYFSRTRVCDSLHRDHGEYCIEKAFEKSGYKIFYPEQLSFEEQLSVLFQCRYFAATEGSVSHNAVFCKKGTEVAIIRKCDFVNVYQVFLNEVADINVFYIDAHKSINLLENMKYRGPFFLCLNNNVYSYLNKRVFVFHRPYYLMPEWWYQYTFNRRIVRKVEGVLKRIKLI